MGQDPFADFAHLATRLTAAVDEPDVLSAAMQFLRRFGPQRAQLVYLHLPHQGVLQKCELLAQWHGDPLMVKSQGSALPQLLADDAIVKQCLSGGAAPLLISERTHAQHDEVRKWLEEGTAGSPMGFPAMALLPLRNDCYAGFAALLILCWETPHTFLEQERSTYELLMTVLTSHLAGLRSQRELYDARAERPLLDQVAKRLSLAVNLDQVLSALLLPAPARAEAEVSLCAIENGPTGAPEWLTIRNAIDGAGRSLPQKLGLRFHMQSLPVLDLYLSSPDTPVLIGDVETDPRVDAQTRALFSQVGFKAMIAIALTVQGRWVGLFTISWPRPVPLGEREQRVYQSLAKQAALLLDNTMMLERLRVSLKEAKEQSELLQTILDHLPVGIVLVEGGSSRPVLGNTALDRILGKQLDKQATRNELPTNYRFVHPGTERTLAPEELPSQRATSSKAMVVADIDILHEDNQRIRTDSIAVPILDESGAVKRVIVMVIDVTARKNAEDERARLREEVIRVQAAALSERSSPLIPITDEILVLPLIGSIDSERSQQVLDTVLHGTSQRGARVAIIDITGVSTIDTQAAAALTSAAQALRLLGVEPVLTGIRAEVAQTMIGLGVQMNELTTRSNLQAGIRYALRRLGKSGIL